MTFRKPINAMCKFCIHDSYQAGKWKQQVQACTSPKCPLFPIRPVSGSENAQFGPFFDAQTLEPTKWWEMRQSGETKWK
jgi:hypothetical protein